MRRKMGQFTALALSVFMLAGYAYAVALPSGMESDGADKTVIEQEEAARTPLPENVSTETTEPPVEQAVQPAPQIQPEPVPVQPVKEPEPAQPVIIAPEASGVLVQKTQQAAIDYSNTSDGYVMMQFTATTDKKLKARVEGPKTTYTYDLKPGGWAVFPLSDGNGDYKFQIFQNVSGTKYSVVASAAHKVEVKDEFAPFIRPNQYVNYSAASKTVLKGQELTKDITDPLKKVEAVYNYVINNVSYDYQKAASVTSGYLPVLDTVLESKKGICFDYAALMTGMLRSQGVPCKLVIGYAGSAYHAWISVWTEATGWIDGVVYFDGANWHRMDPTFASTGRQSKEVMAYIGNGSNYTVKYLY